MSNECDGDVDLAECLGQRLPDADAKLALLGLLGSSDSLVRSVAAEQLGRIAEDVDVIDALRLCLRGEKDDTTKACLLESLGDSRSVLAVDDVQRHVHDENVVVRMHACSALGRLAGVRDGAQLTEAMDGDSEAVVRIAASIAAARLGFEGGLAALARELRRDLVQDEVDIALNLVEDALCRGPRINLPPDEFLEILARYRKDYYEVQVERIAAALIGRR